jgi:DNA polymerase-3 subunit beta
MKFSCKQENLKKGLMTVGMVAGKNVNLPILSNVLIKIEGNSIQFVSTNLEVAVSSSIRGKVDEAGEFTLPSKLLNDYVSLLPDERVDFEQEGSIFTVSCGKNTTKIKGIAASEFPLVPKVEGKYTVYVSLDELNEALDQVAFAVSNVESRPELTGIFFNVNPAFAPGKMIMAATDSYRLSERSVPLSSNGGKKSSDRSFSAIVPGKTMQEFARMLSLSGAQADGVVEFTLGESQAVFRFGDTELISRVIEGRYPDYRPIVPERFLSEAVVKKTDIVQAVKSAALFSKTGLQDVHLVLDPKEGIKVSSSEGQLGKNESSVEAEVTGQKNAITVNYRYFLDGIGAIEASKVRFRMIDAMNPCVLGPADGGDAGGFLYIVMPIKA